MVSLFCVSSTKKMKSNWISS